MTTRRLTADEFDALRPRLGRLALGTVAVARSVLVEGLRPIDAAGRFGISRQRVHGIVKRFEAAIRQVPSGWRRVEVWLPPDLVAQVEAMARRAHEEHIARRPATSPPTAAA